MKYRRHPVFNIDVDTHPHLKHVTKCWTTYDDQYFIAYDNVNGYRHLRVSRLDGQPVHNYMDMQKIKNDLLGKDVVAVEVYPRQSDFRDGSNTYHLWTWDGIKVPNLTELYEYIDEEKNNDNGR